MKRKISIIACTLMFVSSCAVKKNLSMKTMDINNGGVVQKTTVVDLEVDEVKVTSSIEAKGNISSGIKLETLKSQLVADILKKTKSDVLVEPIFVLSNTVAKTTLTVTGFPARYKNFRTIEKEDVELLQVNRGSQEAPLDLKKNKNPNPKKRIAAIVGGVVVTGLVGGVTLLFNFPNDQKY
jgi:uncharacterized lipoprotein YmbA